LNRPAGTTFSDGATLKAAMTRSIVILGAGPAGLAAADRLDSLGCSDFAIYERNAYPGGLCSSVSDGRGYLWDRGGHVVTAHHPEVETFLRKNARDRWSCHLRDCRVFACERWVPYPFQKNLRHLPPGELWECVEGLLERKRNVSPPAHFHGWLEARYGRGIARHFMLPYNRKAWLDRVREMDFGWAENTLAPVSLSRTLKDLVYKTDNVEWGPHRRFRYPGKAGMGGLFAAAAGRFPKRVFYRKQAVRVDPMERRVFFKDGGDVRYDYLVSTLPLTRLAALLNDVSPIFDRRARGLSSHDVITVGLGFRVPDSIPWHWTYYPQPRFPFFRVTRLSGYARDTVPEPGKSLSLLCEIAWPTGRLADPARLVRETLRGLREAGVIADRDRRRLESVFTARLELAYPLPSLNRNAILLPLLRDLEQLNIFSRGRGGAWRYERGSMEQAILQGFESAERIVNHRVESVVSELMDSEKKVEGMKGSVLV
jgi:UDP-galactopyranose mutase